MKASATPRGSRDRSQIAWRWLPFTLALLLSLNTLPGDFVFDDVGLIENGAALREFDVERIFLDNYWGAKRIDPNYRPLTLLSYALNFRLGDSPWVFHLVNVLLNALVVLLFHRICERLFERPALAALAACLYAAMPIRVEAVANIVGRAEILAALATLGAWLAVQSAPRGEGTWRPWIAGGLIFLGLCSKENAAAATLSIPAVLALSRGVIAWRTAVACGLAVIAYLGLRQIVLAEELAIVEAAGIAARRLDNPLAVVDAPVRVVNALAIAGVYVSRAIVPVQLVVEYSYNAIAVRPLTDWTLWTLAAVNVTGVVVVVAGLRRRFPLVVAGVLFFAISLAPVANVLLPIGTIFAERLAYLPAAGLALALAGFLEPRDASRTAPSWRPLAVALLVLLVGVYSAVTFWRNAQWQDRATFYVQLAEMSPQSARAHRMAGRGHLLLAGRATDAAQRKRHLDRAVGAVRRALDIYPEYAHARAFLGEVLLEMRRFAEAREAFLAAREMFERVRLPQPEALGQLLGRATVYAALSSPSQEGDAESAARRRELLEAARTELDAWLDSETARRHAGARVKALRLRAIARFELGDRQGARKDLDEAIRARADWAELYNDRGYLRYRSGDLEGAIEDYRRGLEICRRRGELVAPPEHNVLRFHERILGVQIELSDRAGARVTLEALERLLPRGDRRLQRAASRVQEAFR